MEPAQLKLELWTITPTTVLFDTIILENDTLKGSRSRFIPNLTRKIPFDSIAKIEVQEGGKNYNYQN